MSAWRHRRCPKCSAVVPGGELRVVRVQPTPPQRQGYSLRKCPRCGGVGQTRESKIVSDARNPWPHVPKVGVRGWRRRGAGVPSVAQAGR